MLWILIRWLINQNISIDFSKKLIFAFLMLIIFFYFSNSNIKVGSIDKIKFFFFFFINQKFSKLNISNIFVYFFLAEVYIPSTTDNFCFA